MTKLSACEQQFPALERAAPPCTERRDGGADHQRHQQQKAEPQDHAEGQEAGSQQRPDPALFPRRRVPYAIERTLQLAEHRGGTDCQEYHADQRRDEALPGHACTGDQSLYGGGAFVADQTSQLGHDLAPHRVVAEYRTRDRDHDDQQRRNREQGVVRERRAHARCIVFDPSIHGGAHQMPYLGGSPRGVRHRFVCGVGHHRQSRGERSVPTRHGGAAGIPNHNVFGIRPRSLASSRSTATSRRGRHHPVTELLTGAARVVHRLCFAWAGERHLRPFPP